MQTTLLNQYPYTFPDRYQTFISSFKSDPNEAIKKLEKQLNKQIDDLLGYVLLSLFYASNDQLQKALEIADTLRFLAAGSKFYLTFAYKLSHPNGFDAWVPEDIIPFKAQQSHSFIAAPAIELDQMIEALSQVESTRIDITKNSHIDPDEDLSAQSKQAKEIITSTLAEIYENQKQYELAIDIYNKMLEKNPENMQQITAHIERLENKKRA